VELKNSQFYIFAAVKCRAVLHYFSSFVFSGPLRLWSVYCLHLKIEFSLCAKGVIGMAFFISIDEQLQLNRGCYFHASPKLFWQDVVYIL